MCACGDISATIILRRLLCVLRQFLTLVDIFVHFGLVFCVILPVLMLTGYILAQLCISIGILIFHPHFLLINIFYTRYNRVKHRSVPIETH